MMEVVEMSIHAYNIDFEKFIALYDPEFYYEESEIDYDFITRFIVRGIMFHFDFAKKIYEHDIIVNNKQRILKAISSRFTMSNYIVEELMRPYCIWFPNVPSRDTYLFAA